MGIVGTSQSGRACAGAGVKAVSPAKRGGATRLDVGEHTRTLTVRRCPSSTTISCGRRKLRIRHFSDAPLQPVQEPGGPKGLTRMRFVRNSGST